MIDMAFQTDNFFIRTDLVCKQHNLRGDTALIDLRICQKFFYLLFQLFPILRKNLRGALLNLLYNSLHIVKLADEIFS